MPETRSATTISDSLVSLSASYSKLISRQQTLVELTQNQTAAIHRQAEDTARNSAALERMIEMLEKLQFPRADKQTTEAQPPLLPTPDSPLLASPTGKALSKSELESKADGFHLSPVRAEGSNEDDQVSSEPNSGANNRVPQVEVPSLFATDSSSILILNDAEIGEESFETKLDVSNTVSDVCLLPVCENAAVYLSSIPLAHKTFNGNLCSMQVFYIAAVYLKPPWEPPDGEFKFMSQNYEIENINEEGLRIVWREAETKKRVTIAIESMLKIDTLDEYVAELKKGVYGLFESFARLYLLNSSVGQTAGKVGDHLLSTDAEWDLVDHSSTLRHCNDGLILLVWVEKPPPLPPEIERGYRGCSGQTSMISNHAYLLESELHASKDFGMIALDASGAFLNNFCFNLRLGGNVKVTYSDTDGINRPNQTILLYKRLSIESATVRNDIIYGRAYKYENQVNLLLGLAAKVFEDFFGFLEFDYKLDKMWQGLFLTSLRVHMIYSSSEEGLVWSTLLKIKFYDNNWVAGKAASHKLSLKVNMSSMLSKDDRVRIEMKQDSELVKRHSEFINYSNSLWIKHCFMEKQLEFKNILIVPQNAQLYLFDTQNNNNSSVMSQQDMILKVIRNYLMKKCMEYFQGIAENNEDYDKFYEAFTKNLKLHIREKLKKIGHLTLTSPRSMLVSQAIGTAMGCIAPLTFLLFYNAFDIGNPNGEYKAPYALVYRNMATLGVQGFSALPQHCLQLCYGFFGFAMASNLVRVFSPKPIAKCIHLPIAMAVPFRVGAYFATDMCVVARCEIHHITELDNQRFFLIMSTTNKLYPGYIGVGQRKKLEIFWCVVITYDLKSNLFAKWLAQVQLACTNVVKMLSFWFSSPRPPESNEGKSSLSLLERTFAGSFIIAERYNQEVETYFILYGGVVAGGPWRSNCTDGSCFDNIFLDDFVSSAAYINHIFMFSLPRPPDIVDLEDKIILKKGGMLRIQISRSLGT